MGGTTDTKPWTCPTCNAAVATPYCPACGESPPHPRDLTLRGLFHQIFHALTDIDGRLIRSFRCLVNHPGALTVAYVKGRRMQYIGPFQLFLLANVLFFAVQSLTNTNIAGSTLDSHLNTQDWNAVAQRLVAEHLQSTHRTLENYTPIFNRAATLNAKSLIILMVVPFTLLLPVMFYRNRQPFVAHVVFALHFYAFLLLLFCVALAAVAVDVLFGGSGLTSTQMDHALSLFNLAACMMYLYVATGTVYGARGVMCMAKALVLAVAAAAILLGYRFVLFLITLYYT